MAFPQNTSESGAFSGVDLVQLLGGLYNLNQSRDAVNGTQAPLNSASSFYTDRTGKTGQYTDRIAQILESMYANGDAVNNELPSGSGGSAAYTDAAKYGDPSAILKAIMEGDRGNMLQQLDQANDLSTRQVDIADYSVRGVADAADRKFSALAPSVDRAAAIASSQGFGDALKRGVADSTQAVGQADELTRKFSDVYAKLRQQSEDSALADNAAKYQSYLAGKGGQVNQNQILGSLANQLFGATASKAAGSEGNFAGASAGVSDRLLRALSGGDSASINNRQVNNAMFSPLMSALVALNQQGLTQADNRFRIASGASQTAATNQGGQVANIMANPWVQNLANRGFNWLTSPSAPPVGGDVNYGNEGRNYAVPNTGNPATTPGEYDTYDFGAPQEYDAYDYGGYFGT